MSKRPVLKIENLSAGYGLLRVLNGLSLEIKANEITVIFGTNGNGKSTLLKCIAGLVKPYSGSILLNLNGEEIDIAGRSPYEIVNLSISLVPEGRGIFPSLTVQENLLVGAYRRDARGKIKQNLESIYEVFPRLKERKKQLAGTLSGGEQQMLAIARALMSEPKILLIDEPSLGLAPILVSEVMSMIKELKEQRGLTVLMTEQNFAKAVEIADRACVLVKGNIVLDSPVSKQIDRELVRKYYLGEK